MKIKNLILNLFLFFITVYSEEKSNASPEWCWTKPDMNIKVQPKKFGYNYGLCQAAKGGAGVPEKKTKITVKMPNIKGFGGETGPFHMRLSSKEIQGDEFVLKQSLFKPDENYVVSMSLPSVGEVQSVELSMDDKDNGNFACEQITIEDGPKNYEFPCAGVMDKKNKHLTIIKQETIEHEVVLTAGKEESDKTTDPIFIAIKGSKGVSEFQILAEEGVQSEPLSKSVELPDMGKFECLYLKTYGNDDLLLTKITLQAKGGEPIEFNNEDQQKIECPVSCEIAFCKGGPVPPSPPPPPPNEDPDAGIDDEDDSPPAEPQSPYPETHKFNCAKLSVAEKEQMKPLTCKTTALQLFDEENYMSGNINYQFRHGLCPPNCIKDSVVMGRGIHNPSSTVCGAAIASGSLPKSGGCITIAKVHGLNSYPKSKISNGVKVEVGSASAWGFYTIKADNTDFSKSDVRILNYKGEPDYQGRVEFRVSGRWGSINIKGTEQSSARYICKALNYIDGEWMNEPDVKDFCETYLDKDYCGFKGSEIHYQGYKCEGEIDSLADCYREIAQEFNHKDDAIIKCSMVDKSKTSEVQPKDGDIRMMGTNNAPAQNPTGRVEMFHDKKWGTVCNKGFVDASADIACKQLGFTGGKSIGGPGAHKACVIGKEDYCEKQGATLIVESLKCSGKEKKISECGGNYKSKCSAEQSAMIKCDGTDGDTSGQTVPKNIKAPEKTPGPQFGNLPLSNPYRLTCETTLNAQDFPGDPGSIYLGFCPPGCQNSDSILRGTSIYSYDSSICKAAIHAGVLQPRGGPITVMITFGQASYEKSLNRRVESESFKYSKKSFVVSHIVSIHKQWSLVNYFAPLYGLVAPHTRVIFQGPLKHNPTQFVQLKSKVIHNQIQSVATTFRRYLQANALLQLKEQKEKKLFEYISPKNFLFNTKSSPDFSDLEENDSLQKMTTFTILMQFEFDQDNGVVELFGHSECQCWGVIYNQDGLQFGEKCTNNMINLGQQIALNVKYHIAITYDKKSQNLVLVTNGKTIYKDKHVLNFQCSQKVNIGYNSFSRSKYLIGKIYYAQVLGQVIPQNALEERTTQPIPTGIKTPKNGADTPDGQKVFKVTQDQRQCVSPCITDPMPETPNSPEPPLPAVLGGPPGGPGSEGPPAPAEGSDGDSNPQPEDEEDQTQKQEPVQTVGCLDLTCDDSLEKPQFQGEVGKQICVFCPKGCSNTIQMVIGSQIFYKTSSICKAGIHDGKIQDKIGGEMIVVLSNPIKHYQGSNENMVNSKELQVDDPTIGFTVKLSVKTYDLKCDTLGTDPMFEKVVGNIKVKCPIKCSFIPNNSFGVGKYADISSVCQAAIHAGASSDNGGSFQLQFIKPQLVYDQIRKNEIISSRFDNTKEEVKRGMVFIANRADAAGYFKEKYVEDIYDNWEKVDDRGALKGPGDWKFIQHPKQPEKTVIQQDSNIEMQRDGYFGTKLFHKNFDADNGLMKLNIWQEKKSTFAIYIRYYDDSNFYVFKFNTPQEQQIILVKRVAGVEKILGQYSQDIPLKQWNRFYIVFDESVISMNMQEGDYRNIPKIISVVDSDVQRGKVALATNGENSVYFDGVYTVPYYENQGIRDYKATSVRNWDDCLKPVNQQHRDRYCQKANGNAKWAIPICKKLINYCEYCCTNIIMRWERIIHYDCIKSCVMATRRHEAMLRSQQEDKNGKPYIPKAGDKIDYMNEKSRKFIPANVKETKPGDDGALIVTVSYFVANGDFKKLDVDFPDKRGRIQRCGEVLQTRTDCEDSE